MSRASAPEKHVPAPSARSVSRSIPSAGQLLYRAATQAMSARPHRPDQPRDRYVAWGLTWLAYASYYLGRKGFSVAKKSLHDKLAISETTLGVIDTLYLSGYALGQFVSGYLGDRYGARRLVGYGMLFAALCAAGCGSASSALVLAAWFGLNGLAQSTGWPGTTRAMAEWTTPRNRGTVMSFWATCYQAGGIVASVVAAWLLRLYGFRAAFWGPALWLAFIGIVVLLVLRRGPGAPQHHDATERDTPPLLRVVLSPLLVCYGLSYFFIKFIRYALLFWLPYFLAQSRGYAEDVAALVATAFEVGGIVGVIALGTLSDRVRGWSRSALAAASLVGLALALLLYVTLGSTSPGVGILALALIGATLFGPDALISGAAAQDAGGARAAASATGFVNGVGSIGAMLEGLCVPWISQRYGWQAVFPVFVALALAAALALVPTLRRAPVESTG